MNEHWEIVIEEEPEPHKGELFLNMGSGFVEDKPQRLDQLRVRDVHSGRFVAGPRLLKH